MKRKFQAKEIAKKYYKTSHSQRIKIDPPLPRETATPDELEARKRHLINFYIPAAAGFYIPAAAGTQNLSSI